jgi:hypothetical protein
LASSIVVSFALISGLISAMIVSKSSSSTMRSSIFTRPTTRDWSPTSGAGSISFHEMRWMRDTLPTRKPML